jgi:L-rhamnonate dehydratase
MRRRTFLASLAGGASSLAAAPAGGASLPSKTIRISDVELWRVEGHREALLGANRQHQVNPLHVYDEYRPKPYHEQPNPKSGTVGTSAIYVKVKTDAGIEGLYGPIDRESATVIDQQLRQFLRGKDALAGETLWDQMHRSNRHSRRGLFIMGISAVDNALWDLRGRYFNVPVYRLLGGPTRPAVEAYGSALGFSVEPEAARARALKLKSEGFRCQKWFMAYGPGDGAAGLLKNVELVRTLREALGEEVDLMFDAYMGWNLDYAIGWAKQAEHFRPRWIEEAFHADKIESFVRLRQSTSIPVAAGEHIYGRWEVYDYLKAGALSVVQTDPEWCGGVSELVRICAVASLFDAQVIPHGHSLHAALHVVAAQSPMTCPLVEYLILKMESWHHFEKYPPRLDNGHIALPERPGFGIELDDAKIEKRTQLHFTA